MPGGELIASRSFWTMVGPRIASRVRSDIHQVGFITNRDKSIWEPTQIITWLGLVWNSTLGTISITPSRVQAIVDCVTFVEAQN